MRYVLERLSTQMGRTVVMTSPVPELVAEIADRLIVIRGGEVVADGSLEELRSQTGHAGTIDDMLHEVIFPETLEFVEDYFAGEQS